MSGIEHRPSFADGIGGRAVLEEMWPQASRLLAGSCVVALEEIAGAIRALVTRARVVAEGAGAASVAAAVAPRPTQGAGGKRVVLAPGPTVCVVSGGNLDVAKLAAVLAGREPRPADPPRPAARAPLPTGRISTAARGQVMLV